MDGFDVVPTVPLVVGDDPRACADPVRPYAALYVGGMGSREQNFYNALAVRMGYAEAAADGPGPLPGPAARATRWRRCRTSSSTRPRCSATGRGSPSGWPVLAAAGVTTCARRPYGDSIEEKLAALTVGRPRRWSSPARSRATSPANGEPLVPAQPGGAAAGPR